MAQAIASLSYGKLLTSTDIFRLVVPSDWLNILPDIRDNNNVPIRVLDGKGIYWEFYLSKRRTGRYKKPVFNSKEWKRFVMKKGLMIGDRFVIQEEDDHFRGTQYRVGVQRLVGGGNESQWVDLGSEE